MTQNGDDWSDLSRAWTELPSDAPDTARANAALIRAVRRRDRLARLNFIGEMLGGLVVVAIVGWTALRHGLPWIVNLAALTFVAFGMTMTWWSRRGDPGVLTETPQAVLSSAVAQARTGERWGWAGVATSLAAFGFIGVIRSVVPEQPEQMDPIPLMVAFLGLCIVGYGLHIRRCRQRRRAHEAALTALEEPAKDA